MKAAVLADTGPLYALADPSGQYHTRATTELEAIAKRGFSIAVSYVTLCEAHTLVLRRLGGAYSREWLAEVLDGTVLLSPEPGDYLWAAAELEQYPDQPITLVDAVTAAMSRRLDVPVWAFDRHFMTMRASIWR
jgi:uncharacterized protein